MKPELLEAVEQVVKTMKQDYIRWATQGGKKPVSDFHQQALDNFNIEIKEGPTYIKLIKTEWTIGRGGHHGGGGVSGFIVKTATKGFVEGDMLKAATYNAPATNFKRGNVFTDANNASIARWTGIS